VSIAALFSADEAVAYDPRDPASVTDLLDLAADLEAAGALSEAAEALRAVLQAQGPTAQIVFMLAELLYRAGDLTAARERYYAAVELDADHLEARSSLGCVLAELGEHELALAALDGVLRQQPDYADAHWHMAGVLHDVGQKLGSQRHLRTFLALAPESPWATMARERLAAAEPIVT
jgi:tetratricopeptide (TPR) repeat protein